MGQSKDGEKTTMFLIRADALMLQSHNTDIQIYGT